MYNNENQHNEVKEQGITREKAYEILKKHNLADTMQLEGKGPVTEEEFLVEDKSVYGHDCYYIGGKGGNALLFVIDAVTGKLYSCQKLEPGHWNLTLAR